MLQYIKAGSFQTSIVTGFITSFIPVFIPVCRLIHLPLPPLSHLPLFYQLSIRKLSDDPRRVWYNPPPCLTNRCSRSTNSTGWMTCLVLPYIARGEAYSFPDW